MNFSNIVSVFLILFSVIDILGSIPIIINLKEKGTKIESHKAAFVAFVLMTVFLFTGERLLGLFGVDVESFAIAGALVLFFMGLEMILGVQIFKEDLDSGSGSIVPIAFPLIAGAGSLTTILAMRAKYPVIDIEAAIFLNILVVFLVLRGSNWMAKVFGKSGVNVLRKVFGIILLAIATKLFRENFFLVVEIAEKTR